MGVRREVAKEYYAWIDMRRRCADPKHHQFKNYGARGITVCERWVHSFTCFLEDVGRAPGKEYSLDRIKNNRGYDPDNVRWATKEQQDNNKRTNRWLTHNGKTLTVAQWAKELDVSHSVLICRLRSGHTVERVLDPYVSPKNTKIMHNGEYKSEAEWSRILGIPRTTIRLRARQGTPIDKYIRVRIRKEH